MIRKMAFLTVLLVCSSLSAQAADKDAAKSAPFVHAVFFQLKKDAPSGHADKLVADARELLEKIPSVRGLKIGGPAKESTPDGKELTVPKDYQIGLLVLFDDAAGLKEYLEHPKHVEYVNRHLKHFEKVTIYDFIDQKK